MIAIRQRHELRRSLAREPGAKPRNALSPSEAGTGYALAARIPARSALLEGQVQVVDDARGIVMFAHGSRSSRHSPRNQFVARSLQAMGLNKEALALLRCEKELPIVPGATHLFEEPGTLQEVARLAGEWFGRHLRGRPDAHVRPASGV